MTAQDPQQRPGSSPRNRRPLRPIPLLLILLAALFFSCGVGAYLFLSSERGQRLVAGTRAAVEMAQEATNAPGASDLRELGCDEAMVTSVGRMLGVLESFGPANAPVSLGKEIGPQTVLVLCNERSASGLALECQAVASTYGSSVDASEPFVVIVSRRDAEDRIVCQGLYSPAGVLIAELGREDSAEVHER